MAVTDSSRVLAHVLLFTLFLWVFPATLQLIGLESILVGVGILIYLSLLAAQLTRTRLSHGPHSTGVKRFIRNWVVGFPTGVIVVNLLLIRVLLSPDPLIGEGDPLSPFVPDYGRFVIQGKVAQIVYSCLLIVLANGFGIVWTLFNRQSSVTAT